LPVPISIRKLIEQALNEARDEFAEIVQRKLEELMGDPTPHTARDQKARPAVRASVQREAQRPSKGNRRTRVPESHMADLRNKVLSAMPIGEPLKKSRIIELARLPDAEEPRIASVLRKLKDEGVLVMRGSKAAATYTRKG
jgi:hypothetical protein